MELEKLAKVWGELREFSRTFGVVILGSEQKIRDGTPIGVFSHFTARPNLVEWCKNMDKPRARAAKEPKHPNRKRKPSDQAKILNMEFTKHLQKGKVYKVSVDQLVFLDDYPFWVYSLPDGLHKNRIAQIQHGQYVLYLGRKKWDGHFTWVEVIIGDQAGWILASPKVRLRKITGRMIRRSE